MSEDSGLKRLIERLKRQLRATTRPVSPPWPKEEYRGSRYGFTKWRDLNHPPGTPEPIGPQPCARCGITVMLWKLDDDTFTQTVLGADDWRYTHRCTTEATPQDPRWLL